MEEFAEIHVRYDDPPEPVVDSLPETVLLVRSTSAEPTATHTPPTR